MEHNTKLPESGGYPHPQSHPQHPPPQYTPNMQYPTNLPPQYTPSPVQPAVITQQPGKTKPISISSQTKKKHFNFFNFFFFIFSI